MQKSVFQILALDGGGLKGLFTASFLAKWEEERNSRVVDHFDLIAGTSTGGVIAIALGLGFSPKQVAALYLEKGEQIFPPQRFAEAKHWLGVKYSGDDLRRALSDLIGGRKLGESRKRLLIPAYDPKFRGIHIFKTAHHQRLQTDYKEEAVHVALATSAAPTYFEPEERESGLELVDGGVWANNPVMLAVAEALGYIGCEQKEVAALRIGTTEEIVSVETVRTSGGKVAMAAPLISFMMRGQSQAASGMAEHVLTKRRFHQVNPLVAAGDFKLDKLSKELVALAGAEWRHQSSEIMDKGFFDHRAPEFVPCYKC